MVKIRVYYHDTDCGGVVYYANYLKYLEQARTEFFEQRGIYLKPLSEQGLSFVVSRQEVDYKQPCVYADELTIETSIAKITAARIEFDHAIKKADSSVAVKAKTIMVCVDKNIRPQAIPDDLRVKFEA